MQTYDIIIVGAGCAGLAAGMYAGRMQLKTLIFGDPIVGGTITTTDIVENYPGFIRLSGLELAEKLREHALDYKDFVEIKEARVGKISGIGPCFRVSAGGIFYTAKTIIFATGMKERHLNVPGEDKYFTRGISTCALCDGAIFKGKNIAVVGGSDSAAKEALLLTQWAKKVFIIYRGDKIHPEPVNMARVEQKIREGKIEIIYKTNILEFRGDKFLKNILLDKAYKGKKEFPIDAVFLSIGATPISEMAAALKVKLNEKKEIIINRASETNVPGFFAAGDVVDTRFKQAITGVGEAVAAVYSAYTYINTNAIVCPVGDVEEIKQKKKK